VPRKPKETPDVSETKGAPSDIASESWEPMPGAAQAQAEAEAMVGRAVVQGDGVTVTIVAEPKPQPRENAREVECVFPGIRRFDF